VSPDTSSLVAVIAALCAVAAACVAVGAVLLARRLTADSVRARRQLAAAASVARTDGPRVRARLDATTERMGQLEVRWSAADRAVSEMTGTLASARGSLEGLTRGRLAMLIRGAGIVSRAARFALLWR
jgi:hypothetical protein